MLRLNRGVERSGAEFSRLGTFIYWAVAGVERMWVEGISMQYLVFKNQYAVPFFR